jgi:hypothetical protein
VLLRPHFINEQRVALENDHAILLKRHLQQIGYRVG